MRASRVTGSASGSFGFTRFVPEVEFPVGSYKSSAFETWSMSVVAASAAPLVHPLSEVVDNSVDGGAWEGAVPCGGTALKIVARRAGARGVIGAERNLSTGSSVQGRRVDEETRVLPAEGGVRFGVYTSPMATQTTLGCSALAVSTAPVGAVGR